MPEVRKTRLEGDTWRRLALDALPTPAWLAEPDPEAPAPRVDVVLSTRVRTMRNLRGRPFPARLEPEDAIAVMREIAAAAPHLVAKTSLTADERESLVGARLLSADWPWTHPGRALLLNGELSVAAMINEEDHLRLQIVLPGDALPQALALSRREMETLARTLAWAEAPAWGYLASSAYNTGPGRRLSAMLHLIALSSSGRMAGVLGALTARNLVFRGLFGESSRAVGAFAQVSSLAPDDDAGEDEFAGAVNYLVAQETLARAETDPALLAHHTVAARSALLTAERLSLADAVRALGWIRWGACEGLLPNLDARAVDRALAACDFRARGDADERARARADNLRHDLVLFD